MMLMTAPSAGRDNSHDISRGLISPVGVTLEGLPAPPPPQPARDSATTAATAAVRNSFFIAAIFLDWNGYLGVKGYGVRWRISSSVRVTEPSPANTPSRPSARS